MAAARPPAAMTLARAGPSWPAQLGFSRAGARAEGRQQSQHLFRLVHSRRHHPRPRRGGLHRRHDPDRDRDRTGWIRRASSSPACWRGGAMAAVMLATYPELFARRRDHCAACSSGRRTNVLEALESMRSAPLRSPAQWGDLVRAASDHKAPWPRISVWHGALDAVVNINNAQASVAQWADLEGLRCLDAWQETVDGADAHTWGDKLEVDTLRGPGPRHADRLHAMSDHPGPFILEAGISSSRRIAGFWGLMPAAAGRPDAQAGAGRARAAPARPCRRWNRGACVSTERRATRSAGKRSID